MKFLLPFLFSLSLAVPGFAEENSSAVPANEDAVAESTAVSSYTVDYTGESEKDVDALVRNYYYNFGRVPLFSTRSVSFTIRNFRLLPLWINSITIQGRGFFRTENCPEFLFYGQSCRVRIFFRPNRIGNFYGQLFVNLNGQEDVRIYLFGRGVFNPF